VRADTRQSTAGFTLIEVLVALIVVGLGMLAVIQTVSQTASNTSYIRDKTIAHWIAMNQLTQVRLQPSAPPIDKSSDELEMAGRKWRWTMEVKQTPVESIRRIEVNVRPSDAPEKSSLAYLTGFYGTAVAPAGTTMVSWKGNKPGGGGGGRQGERRRDSETEPPPQTPLEPGEPVPSDPDPEQPNTETPDS
jgi:general secretion pathway protein I